MASKRKLGRSKSKCKQYRDRGTREDNKRRDLKRHLRRFIGDQCGWAAFEALAGKVGAAKFREVLNERT